MMDEIVAYIEVDRATGVVIGVCALTSAEAETADTSEIFFLPNPNPYTETGWIYRNDLQTTVPASYEADLAAMEELAWQP